MRSGTSHNVRQLNSLATRHMELLGASKALRPAYVPKQLLAGQHRRQASESSVVPLVRTASRGMLVKGCTVTTEYKFKRKVSHLLRPYNKQPLLTRVHTSLLLKRPAYRVKLMKVSRPKHEDAQAALTPWKHDHLSATWT